MSGERTCPGWCCAVFWQWSTPEEQRATGHPENLMIADMTFPITVDEAMTRLALVERAPAVAELEQLRKEPERLHSCRHFDIESRMCTVYDKRPGMCRDYPYDKECAFGCGYRPPVRVQTKWLKHRAKSQADAEAAASLTPESAKEVNSNG